MSTYRECLNCRYQLEVPAFRVFASQRRLEIEIVVEKALPIVQRASKATTLAFSGCLLKFLAKSEHTASKKSTKEVVYHSRPRKQYRRMFRHADNYEQTHRPSITMGSHRERRSPSVPCPCASSIRLSGVCNCRLMTEK